MDTGCIPFDATADFLGDIDAIAGDRGQPLSWWQWEDMSSRPALSKTYLGMDETLSKIQKCIDEEGPFDGVLGFSQVPLAASIKLSLPQLSPTTTLQTARSLLVFLRAQPSLQCFAAARRLIARE